MAAIAFAWQLLFTGRDLSRGALKPATWYLPAGLTLIEAPSYAIAVLFGAGFQCRFALVAPLFEDLKGASSILGAT